MNLVAVGESIKNLDKVSNKELLNKYPQIQWKQMIKLLISHEVFNIAYGQNTTLLRPAEPCPVKFSLHFTRPAPNKLLK